MKTPSRLDVTNQSMAFVFGICLWMAILTFIELAPKGDGHRDSLRLILTLGYFGVLLGLLNHLRTSLPQVLWKISQWCFEDAPPDILRASKNLMEELEFMIQCQMRILSAFIASTGLLVLNAWFPAPDLIVGAYHLAWWLTLLLGIVFLYWLPSSLDKVFQQYRFLRRQVQTCDHYQPRNFANLVNLTSEDPDPVFKVQAPRDGFVLGRRPWTFKRMCENVVIFGSTGSGKTICVMNALLDRLIASKRCRPKLGGLILDYKGDYLEKVKSLCQAHGREKDLIVISPHSGVAWNPLDCDESEHEIAAWLVTAMKALGHKDEDQSFFTSQSEALLANSIAILRATNTPGEPPHVAQLYNIINEEAFLQNRLRILDEQTEDHAPDCPGRECFRYFSSVFSALPNDTKQCVVATLNNMLDPLRSPLIASVVRRASSFQLADATNRSKIIYLDLPMAQHPKAGKVLGVLLKLAFQTTVRRKPRQQANYSFFFADEYQEFYTNDKQTIDTRFFSISREYNHMNIIATQNLNNLTMQDDKPDAAMSLLSNNKIKIFLQNDNKDTNQYASELFGQQVIELGGGTTTVAQVSSVVSSVDFLRLRKPSSSSKHCEAIILDTTVSKVDLLNRLIKFPIAPIPVSRVHAPQAIA